MSSKNIDKFKLNVTLYKQGNVLFLETFPFRRHVNKVFHFHISIFEMIISYTVLIYLKYIIKFSVFVLN